MHEALGANILASKELLLKSSRNHFALCYFVVQYVTSLLVKYNIDKPVVVEMMEILATMLAFPFNSTCEIYKDKDKQSTCFKIKEATESRPKELQSYCVVTLHNLLVYVFTHIRRVCVDIHLSLYLQCQIQREVLSSELLLKIDSEKGQ